MRIPPKSSSRQREQPAAQICVPIPLLRKAGAPASQRSMHIRFNV
jgi:hypothetical protein